jgi:transposase-like protein
MQRRKEDINVVSKITRLSVTTIQKVLDNKHKWVRDNTVEELARYLNISQVDCKKYWEQYRNDAIRPFGVTTKVPEELKTVRKNLRQELAKSTKEEMLQREADYISGYMSGNKNVLVLWNTKREELRREKAHATKERRNQLNQFNAMAERYEQLTGRSIFEVFPELKNIVNVVDEDILNNSE